MKFRAFMGIGCKFWRLFELIVMIIAQSQVDHNMMFKWLGRSNSKPPDLCRIISIQVDIFGGEVACPEADGCTAAGEGQLNVGLTIVADVG